MYGRIRPARTRPRLRLGLVLASRIHPYTAPRGLIYNTYRMPPTTRVDFACILRIDIHRYRYTRTVRAGHQNRVRTREGEPEASPSQARPGRGVVCTVLTLYQQIQGQ